MKSKSILAIMCAAATSMSFSGCGILGKKSDKSNSVAESSVNLQSSKPVVSTSFSESESQPDISESVSEQTSEPVSEPESESASEPVSVAESKPEENSSKGGGGVLGGLTYEEIYNDYSKKMEGVSAQYIDKLTATKGGIDELADVCTDGIDKLAELCTEGVDKMADRIGLNGIGYSEWTNKLTTKYMDESNKITSKYMELSKEVTIGEFGGFDFSF